VSCGRRCRGLNERAEFLATTDRAGERSEASRRRGLLGEAPAATQVAEGWASRMAAGLLRGALRVQHKLRMPSVRNRLGESAAALRRSVTMRSIVRRRFLSQAAPKEVRR